MNVHNAGRIEQGPETRDSVCYLGFRVHQVLGRSWEILHKITAKMQAPKYLGIPNVSTWTSEALKTVYVSRLESLALILYTLHRTTYILSLESH